MTTTISLSPCVIWQQASKPVVPATVSCRRSNGLSRATRSLCAILLKEKGSFVSACLSASPRQQSRKAVSSMSTMSKASISTMMRTTMSRTSSRKEPVGANAMRGFLRADGRKGIRNFAVVAYLVECAHHVARQIAQPYQTQGAQLIGFPGCYPSDYAHRVMDAMCTHPNVGAVLLVSLGCEEFRRSALLDAVQASGRVAKLLVIQECGGTRAAIDEGRQWLETILAEANAAPTVPVVFSDLVIGTKCGGSDGLSGITINPAVGRAFDRLGDAGATLMFEETCELIGCQDHMAERAVTPELGQELKAAVEKADRYYSDLGHGSFGGGNIKHGLSTLEEKSL